MSCDCCTGMGCRRCEPEVCEVCDQLFEFVEDHAACLNGEEVTSANTQLTPG